MNVFEDLIDELKQENLLETTVIDVNQRNKDGFDDVEIPDYVSNRNSQPHAQTKTAVHELEITAIDNEIEDTSAGIEGVADLAVESQVGKEKPNRKPRNGLQFYQKRAVSEISNLQMVEHVLTGVERQYMKIVPTPFDDFSAKKALNAFLQVTENENSDVHTQAEFNLLHETEGWCTALSERDRKVPVSSLRQYCENSRPPLSSQALLALARFYRNLPYSEAVRSKFDFVITRLFSRTTDDYKRVCMFSRDEIHSHVNTLYKEWSSIALYSADDDQSGVLMTALSFEDLAIEAENAGSFDQLVESDFFARLRLFKESVTEMFYAPHVTAAAIETNVRVGNAYVSLIERERGKMDAESIESKYGAMHDDSISDATARTVELVDLLRSRSEPVEPVEEMAEATEFKREPVTPAPKPAPAKPKSVPKAAVDRRPTVFGNLVQNAMAVNKWFLAVSGLLVAASIGLYIYSNFFVTETVPTAGVKAVKMDNHVLKEHIKTGKLSGEIFYGMLEPSWDALPKEKRLEFLQKVYEAGKDEGYTQVNLTAKDGKTAAFASATRMEVVMP